jgi:GTP-binding protein Era
LKPRWPFRRGRGTPAAGADGDADADAVGAAQAGESGAGRVHVRDGGERHARQARDSLAALRDDPAIPPAIRRQLAADFAEVEAMLGKLERGDVHIAAFGRVSVGKSALLNALAGREVFEVGVLHGTTRTQQLASMPSRENGDGDGGRVMLIDTPGIEELDGDARERLAFEVAARSDLLLFVVDRDPVRSELAALDEVLASHRPLLLVLNKADRYSPDERDRLLVRLREHVQGRVPPENVVAAAARPAPLTRIGIDVSGRESREVVEREADIAALQGRLLDVLEREGHTLAALNAGLFAGQLSDQVAQRVAMLRREHATRVIRGYCLAKGVAVALNPVPVADLVAAAGLDVALVVHLGKVYGLPLTRREAGRLVATIAAQLAALMAGIWGVHVAASALKAVSAGLTTAVTAGAQGALGWYATLIVGRAVERWLVQGKSWGPNGAHRVVRDIVDSLDRGSVLREARGEILARIGRRGGGPAPKS